MATMNISLPERMKDFVSDQIESGVYANASDYVRALIRRDLENHELLRAEIDKGDASGISSRTVMDIWEDVKARSPR